MLAKRDERELALEVRTSQGTTRDKGALSRQLRSWARLADLKRILVSHGTEITQDPARTLLRLADSLAPLTDGQAE